jgi:hypothetical protein
MKGRGGVAHASSHGPHALGASIVSNAAHVNVNRRNLADARPRKAESAACSYTILREYDRCGAKIRCLGTRRLPLDMIQSIVEHALDLLLPWRVLAYAEQYHAVVGMKTPKRLHVGDGRIGMVSHGTCDDKKCRVHVYQKRMHVTPRRVVVHVNVTHHVTPPGRLK